MSKPIPSDSLPTVDSLSEFLGEGVHTALRKVGDSHESTTAWLAICDMDSDEWGGIMNFVATVLRNELERGVL